MQLTSLAFEFFALLTCMVAVTATPVPAELGRDVAVALPRGEYAASATSCALTRLIIQLQWTAVRLAAHIM